jgi:hypothetical protein
VREIHEAHDHHLHLGLVLLPGHAGERARHAVPGVVHQRVHHDTGGVELGADARRGITLGHVGDDNVHAPAVPLAEPRRDGAQAILAPGREHEVESAGGKHLRKGLADARRRAGDERSPERGVGCHFSRDRSGVVS